jgi:hypothetical protein
MKDLGVELICAHSPQAKGRVERRHAVFQDRLVKEMRLRQISSMEQGNALLESLFLKDLNGRYALESKKQQDLHREVEAAVKLKEVLCVMEARTVGEDWCVRWKSRWLQIDKRHEGLLLAGKRVLVKELAAGELIVQYKGQRLVCQELSQRAIPMRKKQPVLNNRRWKPGADHPWSKESNDKQAARLAIASTARAQRDSTPTRKKAG